MRRNRWLTLVVVLAMLVSLCAPAASAVSAAGSGWSLDGESLISDSGKVTGSSSSFPTRRDEAGKLMPFRQTVTGGGTWNATQVDRDFDLVQAKLPQSVQDLRGMAEQYEADQMVTAFVVLEEEPLAATYSSINSVKPSQKNSLLAAQDQLIDQIQRDVLDGQELQIRYQFTYLLNGFSMQVEFERLEQIAMLDGVKSVFVMPVFQAVEVEDVTVSPNTVSSGEMTGVANVWQDLGYTGTGMKIAVIDTGLDLDHPSFAADPELASSSMTEASIEKVLTKLNAYDLLDGLSAQDLYRSAKVPYAFNYVDANLTADHSADTQGDHGTHVAGIAAANKVEGTNVAGMAPDAQLVIMKVFGASGGAYLDDIAAALEDAMTLGCDVVNASVGSPAGFSVSGYQEIDRIYDRIADQDIVVNFSAGNEGTSSYGNLWGTNTNTTSNPDNATVGSPSTYDNVMSVASVDNQKMPAKFFTLADGTQIFYQDPYEYEVALGTLSGQELEYVMIDGFGEEADFYDDDGNSLVEGKVAIVIRGSLNFGTKVFNAQAAGAIACLIWDNVEENIFNFGMQIHNDAGQFPQIPAGLISLSSGHTLEAAQTKTLVISEEMGFADNMDGGQMSSFSSWGVSPDLGLVPDITGVGGYVYSCYDGGGYGVMSGTSMSSPQVAGVTALVMEYLKGKFPDAGTGELRDMTEALLMSTAVPVVSSVTGLEASPRQQGAGLVDAYDAVTNQAYLTVDGGRPKAELGDGTTGTWSFSFQIHNFSDEEKTYTLDGSILSEAVDPDYAQMGLYFMAEYETTLSGAVTFDQESVTVAAGGTAQVTATITLSEEDIAYFTTYWPNGGYVEGYIYLTNAEGKVEMSMPYLGFYGDWTEAPVFDSAYWYDNSFWNVPPADGLPEGHQYYHVMWTDFGGSDWVLGVNPYSGASLDADGNVAYSDTHNVVSPNGDGYIDGIDDMYLSLLRNAKEMTFTYTIGDTVVHEEVYINNFKTMYGSGYGQVVPWVYSGYGEGMYDYLDDNGQVLADGTQVMLTISAKVDYGDGGEHTMQIPIYVDTHGPELVNVYELPMTDETTDQTTYYMVVEASDVTALAGIYLFNPSGTRLYGKAFDDVFQATGNGTYMVAFNITGLGTEFTVALTDYGANESYYKVEYESAGDNLPEMDKSQIYAYRIYDEAIASDHVYGWISMNKPGSAEETTNISVWTDDYLEQTSINAAEYVGGKILAVDSLGNYIILDPGLFDRTVVTNLGINVLDMTFDDAAQTMYLVAKDGSYVTLYTMDMLTGDLTPVKYYGYYGNAPWAIADDGEGTIYAIRYNKSELYYLDVENDYALTQVTYEQTTTGEDGSQITEEVPVVMYDSAGEAVKPSNYAQSLTYSQGKLYWAYFRSSWSGTTSEMIVVDTADWSSFASTFLAQGYDSEGQPVEYEASTELVGLLTLEDTAYTFPAAESISDLYISAEDVLLRVGQSASVRAAAIPWNYEVQNWTWTSADESVAIVEDGTILAVGPGQTTVTVNADGVEKTITVTSILVEGNFNAYNYFSMDGYYGYMIDVDMQTMDYYLDDLAPVDFMAGDYNGHDGCFYGYDSYGGFYRWDRTTGEVTELQGVDTAPMDMAYDYTTGLMYGVFTDANTKESQICIINMRNGQTMAVAEGYLGLMTLACDDNGILYALDYAGNLIQLINEDGAFDQIILMEELGALNYVQSMCWDHTNDVLLWAWCDGTSIRWIDVEYGVMVDLGDPTDSGLFEFVGMYTDMPEEEMPALAKVDVTEVIANNMFILNGETVYPDVTVLPFNATNQELTMIALDKNVAVVNQDGTITATGVGQTEVVGMLWDDNEMLDFRFTITVVQGAYDIVGHVMADLATYGGQYWIGFSAYDPESPDLLGLTDYQLYGGEYVDGKLYTYGYDPSDWDSNWQFMIVDADTFEIIEQYDMGESFPFVYDMTYDYTTGTMYAIAGSGGESNDNDLYVVDMSDGRILPILQLEEGFMSVTASDSGVLYAMKNSIADGPYNPWLGIIPEFSDAVLYTIDTKTLAVEEVGSTGMKCNLVASLAYDYDNGLLYWTPAFRAGSGTPSCLAIVEPDTGIAHDLGKIGGSGAQVCGMYILCQDHPEMGEVELSHLFLEPAKSVVATGQTVALSLTTVPMHLDAQVEWSSSDDTIATVDENGVVTGVSQGKVQITASATYGDKTLTATVQVTVIDPDASFLTWNATNMGWSMINRMDQTNGYDLTQGEELGVTAIANVGDTVYGFSKDNSFFLLDTDTMQRQIISQELQFDYQSIFSQVEGQLLFEIADMEYDPANDRMLAIGSVWAEENEWIAALIGGDFLLEVDLQTGAITNLGALPEPGCFRGLAVGGDGTVYLLSTFDDAIYRYDLATGLASQIASLRSQSVYCVGSFGIHQSMYYDDLTGLIYLCVTSNGESYRMMSLDPSTGLFTVLGSIGAADGWGSSDLFSGLAFVHIHSYGEPVFVWSQDMSSCNAVYTCDCDEVRTVACDVQVTLTEPTCTEGGQAIYVATCEDGSHQVTVDLDPLGHDYVATVTDPTCTEQGYTTYTCSRCGDNYIDSYTDPAGHTLVKTEAIDATCTEDGNSAYYTCSACGKYFSDEAGTTEIEKDSWIIQANGHTLVKTEATDATCTEDGNSAYYTCSACGKYFSDAEGTTEIEKDSWIIQAKGHTLVKTEAVEATCTEDGNSAYYTCSVCGKYFSDAEGTTEIEKDSWIIQAKGHTLVKTEATDPTCTETGNSIYYTCSVCGKYFSDEAGTTEIEKDSWIIPANGHTWDEGKVTKEPTCEQSGVMSYTCACGQTKEEQIPATGHEYDSVVTPPTATEGGYTTHTCKNCGHSYVDSFTDPTGGSVVPPTGPVDDGITQIFWISVVMLAALVLGKALLNKKTIQ